MNHEVALHPLHLRDHGGSGSLLARASRLSDDLDSAVFLNSDEAALDGGGVPRAANDDSGIEFPSPYILSMLFTFG
jgi:hypothetical protein